MSESVAQDDAQLADPKTFREALGLNDEDVELLYRIGHQEFSQEQYDQADTTFRMLCLIDHGSSRNWMGLGAVRQKRGDYLGAIEAYGAVPELGDFNPRAPLYAAECLITLGAPDDAVAGLDQALDWAENDHDPASIVDEVEVLSESVELMLAAGTNLMDLAEDEAVDSPDSGAES